MRTWGSTRVADQQIARSVERQDRLLLGRLDRDEPHRRPRHRLTDRLRIGRVRSKVYQSVDDPNEVIIEVEFPTVEAAKAFQASQELRETQQRAGLKEPARMLVVNET